MSAKWIVKSYKQLVNTHQLPMWADNNDYSVREREEVAKAYMTISKEVYEALVREREEKEYYIKEINKFCKEKEI